jgi:hypothetical protein
MLETLRSFFVLNGKLYERSHIIFYSFSNGTDFFYSSKIIKIDPQNGLFQIKPKLFY